jgi:plasmid stabilization system protein ParE
MKAKKVISEYAKIDISDASKWYEKQQKGLGKRFLNEIRETFNRISENPTIFQVRYDNNRICFTNIFPYGIHYEYIHDRNEIYIKAVFHTARNPQIWK